MAFIAVLGRQWILYFTQATSLGNIVDRGKEHQAKLVGLRKWRMHLIMELLPIMLQISLLLFGVALVMYLLDLNVSAAYVVLVVTSIGLVFYTSITVAATIYGDCPFKTPLSILFPRILLRAKEPTALTRVWLRQKTISGAIGRDFLGSSVKHMLKFSTGRTNTTDHTDEDISYDV